MDIQNIILIVIAVLDLFLGYLIFKKDPKNEINISYTLYVLWVILWTGGIAIFRYTDDLEVMLFANRLFIVAAALIFSSILHFSYLFPYKQKNFNLLKRFWIYFPNIFVILAVLIPGVMIENILVRDWGNESILGWGYIYYGIYVTLLAVLAFKNLFIKLKKSNGVAKAQTLYVILGLFVSLIFGATFNLAYILLGNYHFIWLGPYASFIMLAFIGYAVLRYRLMDIRIVARKIFIYVGITIVTYGILLSFIKLYILFFGGVFPASLYIIIGFATVLFVAVFLVIINLLKIFANKYLFFSLYNYQEAISKLSKELNYYTDINKISNTIVNSVTKLMKLERAGVLLIDKTKKKTNYKIIKLIGFDEKDSLGLVKDTFLIKYLKKTKSLLVRYELAILAKKARGANQKNNFRELQDYMQKVGASICLPLIAGKKLIGIIILGPKISRDAYMKEDLELLEVLASQASIAIDNARLYQEVKDFSKTLQDKVDVQTESLQKTNEELELRNKLNKELLEMKSDFLRVVNHQLNTPLSLMKAYFTMLEEGKYNPEKAISFIEESLDRISQTVSEFRDAYELEGEKMKMNPQKVNITDVVDKLIKEKKNLPLAKQRGLKISIKKPNFKIPTVWCDLKKITHVISNLLDNAVFYTYRGEVVLYYEVIDKKFLKINIKDSGIGISEEDQKNLFQKFSRGKKASGMQPDGSGLGLYIARKIVEGNEGEIAVSSNGRGKGSVFSFTIPLFKNQKNIAGEKITTKRSKIEMF